jgi:hypothetical protein
MKKMVMMMMMIRSTHLVQKGQEVSLLIDIAHQGLVLLLLLLLQ